MSRPQKIHSPLPFTFNQVLSAVGMGSGTKPAQNPQSIQGKEASKPSAPKPKNSK